MKHKKVTAITFAAVYFSGTQVFSAESMCPDYPGHREVLDRGNEVLRTSPDKPGHRDMPSGTYSFYPQYRDHQKFELKTADEYLKIFHEIKKTNDKERVNTLTVDVAYNLFAKRKYKVCREFLEGALPDLLPDKRDDLYDVLAICFIAKDSEPGKKVDNTTYLNQLVEIAETQPKLTESEKYLYSKAKMYLKQSLESSIQEKSKGDQERILRVGLLSIILNEPEEAKKFKTSLIESLRKREYVNSQNLFRTSMQNSLRSTFLKYPSGFLDDQGFPAWVGAISIVLDGTIVLCKRVGTSSDLEGISVIWARELSELDLKTSNHVAMIQNLPESERQRLLEPKFRIGTDEFSKIYKAIKDRGWNQEAELFEKDYLKKHSDIASLVGIDEVTRYHLSTGDVRHAMTLCEEEMTNLKFAVNKSESNLSIANQRMKVLADDLKKYKVPPTNPTAIRVRQYAQEIQDHFDKLECLNLADKLTQTGWNLIECGDGKNASKMYESALDIRKKNLNPESRLLGSTYFGAAQAAALDNNFPLANSHFQKAIAIFKSNNVKDDRELVIALESYGSLLNKNNKYDEAQKVYDQVRLMK